MFNRLRFRCLCLLLCLPYAPIAAAADYVETPYSEQKVVFDFYFDDPQKINSALYWIRSLLNPLMDSPYGYAPEELSIKVVVHGTEIVTLARHNEEKYKEAVERMRYYSDFGIEFLVCAIASDDFGYSASDYQDFVTMVPSAMTELAHWQMQGYGLITPQIKDKKFSVEEIR